MTLLNGSSPTAEEFHYRFDTAGRMLESAFAQTSQNSSAPFYPSQASPGANTALRRALAVYDYRPAGELAEVRYHWQNWDEAEMEYVTTNIGKVAYAYAPYTGLRTSATRYEGNGTGWGSGMEDEYQYDADLDYLTAVDYSSTAGSSFTADDSWTYDAAGNRSNSGYTYDNLNRMTASPGATYANDILGNRTFRNPESSSARQYVWDDAGRLLKSAEATKGATYSYRADGMRIRKVTGLHLLWIEDEETASGYYDEEYDSNNPTYRYRYDGQMCLEDDYTVAIPGSPPSASLTGNSYALGARGIDMMRPFSVNVSNYERTYSVPQFPIYDGHGNMIATLVRDGTSWDLTNERAYDVWGGVRSGSSSGDPNNRYCANLGHKQDDESGLIYMRARYYEPGTGRFISQDPAMDGLNWFTYCGSDPVNMVDESGHRGEWDVRMRGAITRILAGYLRDLAVKAMLTGALMFVISVGFAASSEKLNYGCLLGPALFIAGFVSYFAATYVCGELVRRIASFESGSVAPTWGLLLMGQFGLAIIGLLLGSDPDSEDASNWGL